MVITQFGYSQSSVLSTGNWYKVGVIQSGIYKLDHEELTSLGLDLSSLNPLTIRIYGNGINGVLPQVNSMTRPEGLVENAIHIVGENDGVFDESDYVLFFARGPDQFTWSNDGLSYEKNIYSDTSYYFITAGANQGKRILDKPDLNVAGITITTFDDFIVFEEDINNLLNSGRRWHGDLMGDGESITYQHSIEGVASEIRLTLSAVSQSPESNSFGLSANGTNIGSLELGSIPTGDGTTYSIKARGSVGTFTFAEKEDLNLQFTFGANSASGRGFIDYYLLNFRRQLKLYGGQTRFRHTTNSGEIITYQIDDTAGARIWNVSDPYNVSNQKYKQGAPNSFTSQSQEIEEFVAFKDDALPAPFPYGKIVNQDLRGDANYDGILISHELFLNEAERLAQFHREHDGLLIKVVTPTQVYNEFSSGRQDVTAIRDYARHVYSNGGRLKYLLLFGDCSYDYKNRKSNNTNFVPTYESRNSFHPIFSHSSDDYFGFFEEEEGEWVESTSGDHTLEVGIGRLPAKSLEEATVMVDKIIHYSTSPNSLGKWRNQITYVADDGDANIHARHVEDLATFVDTTYTQYKIEKLLLDRFNQEVNATNERSPETTRALKTRIKEGTFSIDFIGHGNERLWMEEQVLTIDLINNLNNRNKLPIFITATCEFGRYDDPGQESGGEKLILKKNGGAIALLTTSRPVFASTNFRLNEAFHRNMYRKVNGEYQRLGDIIKGTKNEGLAGPVNRNFTLLGDPMMMPAFPQLDIEINELLSEKDTLSALEEITFSGTIEDNGTVDTNFNGIVDVAIFDKKQIFRTKGQQSSPYNYALRSNALFRGKSTVENGIFSFTFVVPKTISYQYENGQISLYAADIQRNRDASGTSTNFVIGGTSQTIENDEPPEVTMYLNDPSFKNGVGIGTSSVLFAEITDENGINTTGNGLINGISLSLRDQVINLNEFYTAHLDSYKSGMVIYPMQDLEPGDYSLALKVHDTHNNTSTTEIYFTVLDGNFISVFNPLAYPNPSSNKVIFSFEHDREEEDLELTLFVYHSNGEVLNRSSTVHENSNRLIELEWMTTTNSGQPLKNGIYFYRLVIRSRKDGALKEITGKLVVAGK